MPLILSHSDDDMTYFCTCVFYLSDMFMFDLHGVSTKLIQEKFK